ncbi:SDR family NAD(P)-dependent oxidoreductase [Streptomyces sp. NBC_01515]|uniref:SDR family NAD(P)-dependent oxidoreductase n=1 Tax=Streptomyces sp. NBC_01515 TaxID=2903890 RepID=UPI00386DA30A
MPLSARTIVVAGATGGVGKGMTLALLRQGAIVVATGRSEQRLTGPAAYAKDAGPGTLITHTVDVGDADSESVCAQLSAYGALDGAVIATGDWGSPERTGILKTSDTEWRSMIASNPTSRRGSPYWL